MDVEANPAARAAIVLCGGRSRRMGSDKASLPFGPESLLERVVARIASVVDEIIVVARDGQAIPALSAAHRVARDPAEGLGPLAGLVAGLSTITGETAFLTSCDVPLLRPEFVLRLFELADGADAVVPRVDGHLMVTSALYSKRCLPAAQKLVARRALRPRDLLEQVDTRIVEKEELQDVDPDGRSFVNCNTPEEYRAALRLAGLD